MRRSSTSSSEHRRWRPVLFVGVGVVLLAEVLLRLPVVEAAVGPPDLFYHPSVTERITALEALQAEGMAVDVLFVGSSVMRTNISPLVFDGALAAEGIDIVSFNAGFSALRPDPVRLYLNELWLDAAEPRVVVEAVRYEEMANAVVVEDFEPFRSGRYEQLWINGSPAARAEEAAIGSSRLLQYAGVLTKALTRPWSLRDEGFEIDERGFNATTHVLADVRAELDFDDIPGGEAARDGYDAPIDESVFDVGFGILEATIETVEARGATLVLVNMPEHAAKFIGHPNGAERYRHYVASLRSFAEDHGVPFIDLAEGGIEAFDDDTMFADFHHMTPEAAEALTKRLVAQIVADPTLAALFAGD